MNALFRPALVLFAAMTLVTGVAYPALVTAVGRVFFSAQVDGSLLLRNSNVVGSTLIGQNFSDPKHCWGRPSATSPMANNAGASGGSNQGPLNPALMHAVKGRIAALRAADPGNVQPVPVDLVTASASGLDPDISIAAARFQVPRIARLRGVPATQVEALIDRHAQGRLLGFIGEPRVNVLALNMALDAPDAAPR